MATKPGAVGEIFQTTSDNKGEVALKNAIVVAYFDCALSFKEDVIGWDITNSEGKFEIDYATWKMAGGNIIIRVYDCVRRLLRQKEFPDVQDETLDVGKIIIPYADVHGWKATLGAGVPQMVSQGNFTEILVDDEEAWQRLVQDIKQSENVINFTNLYFDTPRFYPVFESASMNPPEQPKPIYSDRIENLFLRKNRESGVTVRITVNDIDILVKGVDVVGYPFDTAGKVKDVFDEANKINPHTVEVRPFPSDYNQALHSKNVIIDDKLAYILGSPLQNEYYNDCRHPIDDPRRGLLSKRTGNAILVPIHDVSLRIEGPAVEHLDKTFCLFWRHLGGPMPDPLPVPEAANANGSIQIVRTLPAKMFKQSSEDEPIYQQGELGILEAYQRAIRNATDYIYLENQYCTEDLIYQALWLALEAKKNLNVIMVVNNKMDAPGYFALQSKWLRKLLQDFPKQFGAFTLWTHEVLEEKQGIVRNYIHAKVGIVDDKWATVGSANLAGQELNYSQHITGNFVLPHVVPITRSDKIEERAKEVNAVFFNGVDNEPTSYIPGDLRLSLWSEHLGYWNIDDEDLSAPPEGGWLNLWISRASERITCLNEAPPKWSPVRILPWVEEEDSIKYLLKVGINNATLKRLKVLDEVSSYDFSQGKWVGKRWFD
jgi:phosphatidylserine/phosphatidylglycerophosphate/cardiolipin synthase-like enzyme